MNTLLVRKLMASALLLALFAFTASNLFGQRIDKMTVVNFSSQYSSIVGNGGNYLGGSGIYYPYDNGNYCYQIAMPFAFNYDNISHGAGTTLYCHFGAVSFTNYYPYPYYYPIMNPSISGQSASYYQNGISAFSGLQISGGVYYLTTGVAPNRVLTIENYQCGAYPSRSYGTCSYQIKLYEGTNAIEFLYETPGINFTYSSSYFHTIGLNSATTPSFVQVVVNLNTMISPSTNYRFTYPLPIELSVIPKTLLYGAVLGGSNLTLCTTVQHVGTGGTLTFNSASITGSSDFTIVSAPAGPLGVGQTSQYCVQFSPSGAGARSATLTIVTNGQDSGTQSVALNGSGLFPLISVDSISRFKKTRTDLGQSVTQWIHIIDSGQAPLAFSGFQISGIDGDQYAITHVPVNPLQVGQMDSLGISYNPTREGKHVATLTILNNSANMPAVIVSLQGTGILPHIVLTPPILLFDSTKEGQTVCKNIDIWNPGSDTLKISANYLSSNDGDFHYTGLSGTDVNIPPDQTKTVNVCFIPLQQGFRQGRITLKTNIIPTFDTPRQDTAGLLTIDLRGTGVPYGVFGNALSGSPFTDSSLVGVSVCRTDTLKNNGDADIMVTGITISGTNGSDFTYSNLPAFPFLLKARTLITFKACGTPDQQGLLSATGTVTGTTAGTAITMTLPLAIFGFKPCIQPSPISLFDGLVLPNNGSDSTICDTIFNCGDIDAIYHVGISGTSQADYTVTPSVSGTVPAHTGSAVFCVKYKPSAIGTSIASLDVTTTDGSVSAKVPLNGAAGCATLTHDAPSVPNTGENGTAPFTFMITNTGTTPWSPGMPTISGSGAGSYQVISVVPDPVPPGGQATVTVQFHPPLGSAGQTLTANITWPNGLPCQSSVLSVDLSGQSIVSSVQFATTTDGFSLEQSYPNPTQGSASFNYTTPKESAVRITVVDLTGNLVRTLITGRVSEGMHTVNFDVRDLVSGTYAYVLESGTTRLVRQFILAK